MAHDPPDLDEITTILLGKKQIADLVDNFKTVTESGGGYIDRAEVQAALELIGVDKPVLQFSHLPEQVSLDLLGKIYHNQLSSIYKLSFDDQRSVVKNMDIETRVSYSLCCKRIGSVTVPKISISKICYSVINTIKKLVVFDVKGEIVQNPVVFVDALRRLALNTPVHKISIVVNQDPDEGDIRIIKHLLTIECDFFRISKGIFDKDISFLKYSTIIRSNATRVRIDHLVPSLSVQDLCTLRKAILGGGTNLEYVKLYMLFEQAEAVLEQCLATNESVELYKKGSAFLSNYRLIEGDVTTQYEYGYFIVRRRSSDNQEDEQEASDERREWTQQQLNAGQGIIGLQMGSNKGANASGINMGNT